jgi:hypothetical protein
MYFGSEFFLSGCLIVCAGTAHAHEPNDPPHQQYSVGDLKLESAESITIF